MKRIGIILVILGVGGARFVYTSNMTGPSRIVALVIFGLLILTGILVISKG